MGQSWSMNNITCSNKFSIYLAGQDSCSKMSNEPYSGSFYSIKAVCH